MAYADDDVVLCAEAGSIDLEGLEYVESTGVANLDASLSAELNNQSKFFGYRPTFRLYENGNKNAIATSRNIGQSGPGDGTILYHRAMLKENIELAQWGGAIVSGVIAHEFAHIFQYNTGKHGEWTKAGRKTKYAELHADYLSGFYMGRKYKDEKIDIKDYCDHFFGMGDYKFTEPGHHGTREERYATVKAGFNLYLNASSKTASFASGQGESYIREYILDN